MGNIERCPACGDESASPPAEVFCVRCATEDYAITEQRLKVARLEEQLAGAVEALQRIAAIVPDIELSPEATAARHAAALRNAVQIARDAIGGQ